MPFPRVIAPVTMACLYQVIDKMNTVDKTTQITRAQTRSKIPFLIFCWISLALVAAGEALFLYLVYPRLMSINFYIVYAAVIAAAVFFAAVFYGLATITATAASGAGFLYSRGGHSITARFLFPIASCAAKFFRYDRAKFLASFVEVNNAITTARRAKITGAGKRILVLLPHCLQADECGRKVTNNAANCARCKKCLVGDFIELGEKHNLKIEVVNGGTLARKRVAAQRPQGVIAVACERDLTLGIQDVHPVPVYGVINERPHGPCVNTRVDMDAVGEAVKFFRDAP